MLWSDTSEYAFSKGDIFLGYDEGRKVGIKTERHALTIAGAGSGKGAGVIIPNLLEWPHNALVIDPKGEAAEATAKARAAMGQRILVLDPFQSSRVSPDLIAHYNPLDSIDPNALTIREDIETIADGIVMRSDPKSAHWDDGAQSLIGGLIAYVKATQPPELQHLLQVRRILMDNSDGGAFDQAIDHMTGDPSFGGMMQEGASAAMAKEGGYFVSNARNNTKWLDSKGMANVLAKSTFSLTELKEGKASVYLVLPANYLGQHGRFLRLFVRCGIEAMARKTATGELRDKQCLFFLDEFFSLGYIDEIAKAAGLMRGYGLQLWPILQDLGQLITLYGREGAETFFSNADIHQFFGNTDQLTLEQISTRIGVKDLSEIPLPPTPPSSAPSGFGQGLASMSAGSKMGAAKATGALVGGLISSATNNMHAAEQAEYQDKMNHYHRAMAEHGKPRLTPDEIAKLVQKKIDVVADHMICFVFGREPLLLKLAPYFRPYEAPNPVLQNDGILTDEQEGMAGLFFGALMFSAFFLGVGILPDAPFTGGVICTVIVWAVCRFLVTPWLEERTRMLNPKAEPTAPPRKSTRYGHLYDPNRNYPPPDERIGVHIYKLPEEFRDGCYVDDDGYQHSRVFSSGK